VAVPDFQSLMRPCLTVHQDRQPHTPTDLRDRLATQLRVSDEDRAVMLPSGRQSRFANRVAWAVTHMAQAGLLDRPARGVTQITDRGIEVLNQYPDRVDMKVLSRFPEYAEFRTRTKQRKGQQLLDTVAVTRGDLSPREAIEDVIAADSEVELARDTDDPLSRFAEQVRTRSQENRAVMSAAHHNGWRATEVSILRFELDSLVRVIYLLDEHNRTRRFKLLVQATSPNQRWNISDNEIAAPARRMYDWEGQLYRVASRFIHLSSQHDYMTRDPFQSSLLPRERDEMVQYLNDIHGGNLSVNSTFEEVVEYLPKVFNKISDRLDFYLEMLERGEDLSNNGDLHPEVRE
jgi:hypothetical protein